MPGYPILPSLRFVDLPKALAFYVDTLGFTLVRGGPEEDNCAVELGAARMMMERAAGYYSPAYNQAIRERLSGRSPHALYIEADDLQGLYERAASAGVPVVDPLAPRPWGQSEFTVEDPEGNWLTFWKQTSE